MQQSQNSITLSSKIYPLLLKQIHNPPKKLFFRGNPEILQKTCIAVVGTREYSDYGEYMTNKIIEELAVLDIAIVSGLAKGIDTIAHKAAIINGLPTIAVLGSGLDNIYPKQNISLAKEIISSGLILSEYEPPEPPADFHFPQRNRIISGLCIATVVIEAPEKSGARITAKLALDQSREIFVVPGDVDNENSLGPLRILQEGSAYPVGSGQDIISVLTMQPHLFENAKPKPVARHSAIIVHAPAPAKTSHKPEIILNLSEEETEIFSIIPRHRGISVDHISQTCALPARKILSALSILEIKGLLKIKDGKYSRRC